MREDMIAHAIQTVAVVFLSVVAGHHHHHSLECEYVEDLVMVIAGAIAHAIDPPLLFSLHQQVEELEVILVEIQTYLADLADLVVQDRVHEVDQKDPRSLVRKETSGSSKEVNLPPISVSLE